MAIRIDLITDLVNGQRRSHTQDAVQLFLFRFSLESIKRKRDRRKTFFSWVRFHSSNSHPPTLLTLLRLHKSSLTLFRNFFRGLENGSILIWSPLYKIPEQFPSLFFDGHSHELYKVLFSPNGRFLASTDTVGKLVIWSTKVKVRLG